MDETGLSRRLVRLLTLMVAFLALGATAFAADLTQLAEQGEAVFRQKCIACHGIGEGDRPTGPDLAGVAERRDRPWLVRMIQEPGRLIAEKDPVATQLLEQFNNLPMPAMDLSDADLEAVLVYLAHPAEVQHHLPEASGTAMPVGNADKGRDLYIGTVAFAKGGAPCLACHGIAGAGLGLAAGANFAPDLTSMYESYGDEGVLSLLETLPFPSMEPIYASRPLTAEEQGDVTAFLAQVAGQPPLQAGGQVAGHVAIAVAVLAALLILFGWGRLNGVRRPLVEGLGKGKGGQR
jgi:mono/diheme cytochrome c family protein